MSKKHKNVIIVHVNTQIVYSDQISVIEFFSEVLDSDDFILGFHGFVFGINFFNLWFRIILVDFHTTARWPFLHIILRCYFIFSKTAEQGMLFASELIWENLLEIPRQKQVKYRIKNTTNDTSLDGVVIHRFTERSLRFNGFCVKHSFKT